VVDAADVQRLLLGHYTVPEDVAARVGPPLAGKQIAVTGFLIRHPQGPFLFDTGFGQGSDENTRYYTVVRRDVVAALAERGVAAKDVRAIANCHFHFDHGGGNHRFPGTTVLCQKAELENARALKLRGEPHADYPAWVDRFAELDPWRVLFAHDFAIWERPSR